MSLTEYTDYKTARTNLNNATDHVNACLPSAQGDEFTICVTDSIKKNVWFIEVVNSSVNNNSITVKGPCIHLVFDNTCPSANRWLRFFSIWDGNTASSFISAMNSLPAFDTSLSQLIKCEIYGSFNQNSSVPGITLNGVFKNNTIDPSDDNLVLIMNARDSAKVGAFVTYLTTYSRIPENISTNGCSFLHGAHSEPAKGAMSMTPLSAITEN